MKMKKVFCMGLLSAFLLSGCSLFDKDEDSIEVAPLPKIENRFVAEKVWSTRVGRGVGEYYSLLGPAIQDYRVYSAGRNGVVSALDLYKGKEIWKINFADKKHFLKPSESALLSGGVTVYGNRLFVGSERGMLFALDTDNGELLWKTKVAGEMLSKPVVTGRNGLVLVHTSNGSLQALDMQDGSIRWTVPLDMSTLSLRGSSAPAIAHGAAVIGDDNGRVTAFFYENGQIIWQQKIAQPKGTTEIDLINDVDVTPVIVDNTVYAVGYNGQLVGLDLRSGQVVWKRDIGSVRDFIVHNGRILIVDKEDHVTAYLIDAGSFYWSQKELENRQLTAPVLYQGYLVVGDSEGYLHWIDTLDGSFVSQMFVDKSGFLSTPVIADDFLVIQAKDGTVYAISRY